MGIGSQIVCDAPNCGKAKQESNHWFVCWLFAGEFRCVRGIESFEGRDLVNVKFACGQNCQHKLFDKFLTTGEL